MGFVHHIARLLLSVPDPLRPLELLSELSGVGLPPRCRKGILKKSGSELNIIIPFPTKRPLTAAAPGLTRLQGRPQGHTGEAAIADGLPCPVTGGHRHTVLEKHRTATLYT